MLVLRPDVLTAPEEVVVEYLESCLQKRSLGLRKRASTIRPGGWINILRMRSGGMDSGSNTRLPTSKLEATDRFSRRGAGYGPTVQQSLEQCHVR